jgi:uncharacterized protein
VAVSEKDRNPASESPGHRARGVTRGATYEGEHGSEKIARTRVSFESDGVELVGYLHHHPRATGKVLLVILGHGFSGTQDRLFDNAGRFAEAGFAALTFDYRSFGESGGEPRQMVSVGGQLEDWRTAILLARGLEGVDPDRIALWGSSLGGGHVIVVAAGVPRVAAVEVQAPFSPMPSRDHEAGARPEGARLGR